MTRSSIEEYAAAIREAYLAASKEEKGRMLAEFCRATGYHPKSAVRLLRRKKRAAVTEKRGRPRRYGAAMKAALVVAWETLGRPCGKRLQPFLAELVGHLERHGELSLDDEAREQLSEVSASTIDRLLANYRLRPIRQPRVPRDGQVSLQDEVMLRTFGEWRDARPGEVQVDLVMHCGTSLLGFHLTTLTTVDVATTWTVRRAVWGKGQDRVGSGIQGARERLPMPLVSIHSDNGSEFLNRGMVSWCRREQVGFTRGRPYRKNDQAWVEQRNDTAVRRLVGYDRYSSRAAHEQLQRVYAIADDYANYFQPVSKLVAKRRQGARVAKTYDEALTPYQRVMASGVFDDEQRTRLEARYHLLNPAQLRRDLNVALERLWRLREPVASVTPLLTQQLAAVR